MDTSSIVVSAVIIGLILALMLIATIIIAVSLAVYKKKHATNAKGDSYSLTNLREGENEYDDIQGVINSSHYWQGNGEMETETQATFDPSPVVGTPMSIVNHNAEDFNCEVLEVNASLVQSNGGNGTVSFQVPPPLKSPRSHGTLKKVDETSSKDTEITSEGSQNPLLQKPPIEPAKVDESGKNNKDVSVSDLDAESDESQAKTPVKKPRPPPKPPKNPALNANGSHVGHISTDGGDLYAVVNKPPKPPKPEKPIVACKMNDAYTSAVREQTA